MSNKSIIVLSLYRNENFQGFWIFLENLKSAKNLERRIGSNFLKCLPLRINVTKLLDSSTYLRHFNYDAKNLVSKFFFL